MDQQELVTITQDYYNSKSADEFYHTVWGGEDIHIGIYNNKQMPIKEASNATVKKMVSMLGNLNQKEMLDMGSGYGGAARYIASKHNCKINCLNLSKVENERNIEKNHEVGLNEKISVFTGNFEDIPFHNELFDIIWSQDAILHSDKKDKVISEAYRLLKPGGIFIFTDPMQSNNCPPEAIEPILQRIHLKELGSVELYKSLAEKHGFVEDEIIEMPEQLINHYSSVLEQLQTHEKALIEKGCETDYIENMKKGLTHWVNGGNKGYLNWGIMKFKKPA